MWPQFQPHVPDRYRKPRRTRHAATRRKSAHDCCQYDRRQRRQPAVFSSHTCHRLRHVIIKKPFVKPGDPVPQRNRWLRDGVARFYEWFLRSEEHTSELQSPCNLVCRLLLEKKKKHHNPPHTATTEPPRPRAHSSLRLATALHPPKSPRHLPAPLATCSRDHPHPP